MIRRLTCAALVLTAAPTAAQAEGWDTVSDGGRDALVVAALGAPAIQGDWSGLAQAGGSLAVTGGTTYLLKEAFP